MFISEPWELPYSYTHTHSPLMVPRMILGMHRHLISTAPVSLSPFSHLANGGFFMEARRVPTSSQPWRMCFAVCERAHLSLGGLALLQPWSGILFLAPGWSDLLGQRQHSLACGDIIYCNIYLGTDLLWCHFQGKGSYRNILNIYPRSHLGFLPVQMTVPKCSLVRILPPVRILDIITIIPPYYFFQLPNPYYLLYNPFASCYNVCSQWHQGPSQSAIKAVQFKGWGINRL